MARSRISPLSGRKDPVNEKGLRHSVKFVDNLMAVGIVPMITLFHRDLPDNHDKRYGGFLVDEEICGGLYTLCTCCL